MTGRRATICFLIALVCWAPRVSLAGVPEIYSIMPSEGAAGDTIRIKGRALRHTTSVLFAAEYTSKSAQFKIVSDKELEVVVPDYYLPDVLATVAVITREGATVGMPAATIRVSGATNHASRIGAFYHVQKEGVLFGAGGISLIEDHGAVLESGPAPMHFVKRGGTLEKFNNAAGIVIHEPGAYFGKWFERETRNSYEWHLKRIEVPQIGGSLGIEPFLFKAPPQAAGQAKSPPRILSIEPPVASYGDVVTLLGNGFLQTSRVFFDRGMGYHEFLPVGFKVVSDSELRVVVPEKPQPHDHEMVFMVVNPKGMTVTLPPRSRSPRDVGSRHMGEFFLPKENNIWFKPGGGSMQLVESGQRVDDANLVFAKNGARISPYVPRVLFYEPEADVPRTALKKAKDAFAVDKIVPSELPLFRMKLPWE